MTLTHCSTCGTALSGRSICPRCGTLVRAEAALAVAAARTRTLFKNQIARIKPFGPAHFLWIASFIPIVIAPPLVSLTISIASMRRSERSAASVNYEWIAIISAVNIILSGIILYKFHFSAAELLSYFLDPLRAWISRIAPAFPTFGPPPPRVIPI